ncbi:MAG: hypothetical protein LBR21_09015 [Propionibacteriaceae bacterium]|nr:hypothetical protein [Propionibacteriaceae bacterium]
MKSVTEVVYGKRGKHRASLGLLWKNEAMTSVAAIDPLDTAVRSSKDFEKDPDFLAHMRARLESALREEREGKTTDAAVVFSQLRARFGWSDAE